MNRNITYQVNASLSPETASQLYRDSTLAERRPTDDLDKMRGMLENADLTLTAWEGPTLVGLARTLTDFCYVAYLADLAVHQSHQRQGVGAELVARTRGELGADCMLVLLAAPAAAEYYPRIGFSPHPSAWTLKPSPTDRR